MKIRSLLRDLPLWLYIFCYAIIIGATIYQMFVIIPAFSIDSPNGMIAFAQGPVEPRKFWTSPIGTISQLAGIITLIINWKTNRRKWLLLSLAFMVITVLSTIIYFIPAYK